MTAKRTTEWDKLADDNIVWVHPSTLELYYLYNMDEPAAGHAAHPRFPRGAMADGGERRAMPERTPESMGVILRVKAQGAAPAPLWEEVRRLAAG